MLNEAFKCPCFGFGAGEPGQAHKENEFVLIENLSKVEKFYEEIIRNWKGGEKK